MQQLRRYSSAMRFTRRPGLAFAICALAATAACGRGPIGGNKSDAGGADATGRAGTTGSAGTIGSVGAAGTGPAAGTTGAAGSNAAAGTNGAAGAPGPCKLGETSCTGPSQAVMCQPNGVWSLDTRFCSYGCAQNVCRECRPATRCAAR